MYKAPVQGLTHGELSVSPSYCYYYYFLFSANCQMVKHLALVSCARSLHQPYFVVMLLPSNPFCTLLLTVFFSSYYRNFLAWHSKPSASGPFPNTFSNLKEKCKGKHLRDFIWPETPEEPTVCSGIQKM